MGFTPFPWKEFRMNGLLSQLTRPFTDPSYPMSNPLSEMLERQGQNVKGAVGSVIRNHMGGGLAEAIANTGLQMAPFTPGEFSVGIGSSLLPGLSRSTAPAPARDMPPSLLKELIERSGGIYKGIQDFGDEGNFALFNEPKTGSTTGLLMKDVNPESVVQKLAEVRGRFK